jgi:hypothetical protein
LPKASSTLATDTPAAATMERSLVADARELLEGRGDDALRVSCD